MNINDYGFLRVAAASPKLKVADCNYNTEEIKQVIEQAQQEEVQILCFPELSLTGYSCGDLFFQKALQQKALESLCKLVRFLEERPSIITIVGLPLLIQNNLYNVAAVLSGEGILGFVPKTYIPNNNEYYEKRWFTSGDDLTGHTVTIDGDKFDLTIDIATGKIPISSTGMIFQTSFGSFGIEICEDLWMPAPPSSYLAMQGADLIFNLSASNELVGKNRYRKSLVLQQSGRCNAAYIYASAGWGESTTDMVFSGACFIAENGAMLAESERFSPKSELIIADIDIEALRYDRLRNCNYISPIFHEKTTINCYIDFVTSDRMFRRFNPHPFIPPKGESGESLSEVFDIQTHGLAKRLLHTGIKKVTIGISGGLDSTLALLVTVKAFDLLGLPRENIYGITMPGFGTTGRTYDNAVALMKSLGVAIKEISIVDAVTQHLTDIGHDINNHDVTYENSQARERTQILMDYANKINGLVVGTGNMSELALGWATYNGDHMSMYGVNTSVPKTLVSTLVRWVADTRTEEEASRRILYDILDTPFSPELLPAREDGKIAQETEHFVGPYELHDFFLHRMLRYGDAPSRIRFMAGQAFAGEYSTQEIMKWLKLFYKRFFAQQFKRSCMPDGPKVGSVNLSPRSDWRMPSDASVNIWLAELEEWDVSG
ncbi:NAD synthetase [Proteiniphilum saccharofermentans]|uniref:Glutamine-dependent NAD(+) synthetase n=1 Tax=Proteiniphilum saccharofermentans TaxID=1642647 RepID=A0A1R3T6Z8_9BACT|nr:NAD(+) synthase [Proteiniphilum saccharofermentans]SCD21869.1 NAD synthetase [Proteiniphilum saccharofermentans]